MTIKHKASVARWIFFAAAIYGIPVLASFFFVTPKFLASAPREQPELFYGFAGVTLAWQFVFVLIGIDPRRYRPIMPIAAVFEKFLFVAYLSYLLVQLRASTDWVAPASVDFLLGCLFLVSFFLTRD